MVQVTPAIDIQFFHAILYMYMPKLGRNDFV